MRKEKEKNNIKSILGGIGVIISLITAIIEFADTILTTLSNEVEIGIGAVNIGGDTDNKYTEYNYDFENMSEKELLRLSKAACLREDYNYAYEIYTCDKMKDNKLGLINLGYIYAHGYSYIGVDYQKAEECYIHADCVEAKRNLLILYLESRADADKIINILTELLFQIDDDITWNYITYTLYDESLETYIENNSKEDLSFELDELFQWEDSGQTYMGSCPPSDTSNSRWIPVGVDWQELTPYSIYKVQEVRYHKYITLIESLYYEENDILYSLEK